MTASAGGLDEDHAIDLCQGALDATPGQCYAQAADRYTELSTQQITQLCTRTTTLEPLACYARLEGYGGMTIDQAVYYCATTCALGPAPAQTSNAQCQAIAVDRANLPYQSAQQLCQGSRSVRPALCFLSGRRLNTISDSKLVTLCADTFHCQYVNQAPPAY
jgi:hypothetical protein